jgi:TonB-dependent SusC/RagA subfamily outer membrane receptor
MLRLRVPSRACRLGVGAALLVLPVTGVAAQATGSVVGTVTTVYHVGVPGVRIQVTGLGLEAVTDADGRFLLASIPTGSHEIRAEMVGCEAVSWTMEIPEGRTSVRLNLDGPAVTGLPSQSAGAGGGSAGPGTAFSVAQLPRNELNRYSARTIADLIRGTFPGVKVVQGSGLPGEHLSIEMRGPSSISGSQDPLVVVDGLITGGGLDDLDPLDVADIRLLKGSAATAVYGARGEAGVIEISTKTGAPTAAPRCYLRAHPSI